jgi:hypothetical protein
MTVNEEVRRAREVRKERGIQREDRGVAEIEELDPDDIAPMVVYLASETAGHVNGQFFLCFGNQIALVSQPRPVHTLYKTEGVWTLDELDVLVPDGLIKGLANPAPPKEA